MSQALYCYQVDLEHPRTIQANGESISIAVFKRHTKFIFLKTKKKRKNLDGYSLN